MLQLIQRKGIAQLPDVTYTIDGYTFTRPSVDSLNGKMDTGTTQKPKTAVTVEPKKEQVTPVPIPTPPAVTVVPTITPKTSGHNTEIGSEFGASVLTVVLMIIIAVILLVRNARKHPPTGGFAHHHKHLHPGKPKPNAFKKH